MGRTGESVAREAAELATAGWRVLLPDRRGYGASAAPEGYVATSVPEQGEDLARLARELGAGHGPAVLAGRDFGALACLEVLLRHPDLVRAAVLEDPPALWLVPEATEILGAERIALEEKLRDGGPRAAMEAWLGGPSDAAPQAFFADFGGLATTAITRRELRAARRPVTLVETATAPGHVRLALAALEHALPEVRRAPDLLSALRESAPTP